MLQLCNNFDPISDIQPSAPRVTKDWSWFSSNVKMMLLKICSMGDNNIL